MRTSIDVRAWWKQVPLTVQEHFETRLIGDLEREEAIVRMFTLVGPKKVGGKMKTWTLPEVPRTMEGPLSAVSKPILQESIR